MNNLGVALLNKRRTKDAIKVLNLAAKMNPSEELARRNLGIAARKYLPGTSLLVGAVYALSQVYRMGEAKSGADMPWASLVIVGLSVGILAMFYLLRHYRFQQLPTETQSYLRTVKRSATISHLRDLLAYIAAFCGSFFFIFSFVAVVLWGDGGWRWHLIAVATASTLLSAALAGVFGVRRLPRNQYR
jgi:hypothetical protein